MVKQLDRVIYVFRYGSVYEALLETPNMAKPMYLRGEVKWAIWVPCNPRLEPLHKIFLELTPSGEGNFSSHQWYQTNASPSMATKTRSILS